MFNILEIMYIVDSQPVSSDITFARCTLNSITTGAWSMFLVILYFVVHTNYSEITKKLGDYTGLKHVYDTFNKDVISVLPFKKQKFFGFFFSLFLFLLVSNLCGLIPFSNTITMFWLVNLFIALATQLTTTLLGLYYNKYSFTKAFLPNNIPVIIALLLVPTEVLSYISRVLSLAIRLFANMFAGHAMLKIISCFVCVAINFAPCGGIWFVIPLALILLVICLEILVSLLQAYVFVNLVLIYVRLNFKLH